MSLGQIPKKKYDPSSCFFLGPQGCLLQARHVICVNYPCKKIRDRVGPQKISALQEEEGIELHHLFFLHERLKKLINKGVNH